MPHDLINRLVFEIDLNCNENEAKTESDMLFEQHISSTLDRVLARYNHIDATFSDTIEIDLGSVPKTDLGYKLEHTLSMIIEQYIGKTRYATKSLTNKTDKHSTAQTFLDYLHHPIIPWDTDNVTSFDRVTLIEEAIKEAMQSESYFKQLLSAISSDIATCRRFFDLSFEQPHFSDIVTKIASSINESDSYVIAEKFKMLSSSLEANPQIFRDISYYIIANMLFANQQNNINIILLSSVLMVESEAVPKSYIFDLLANIANKYGNSNQSKYASHTNKKILSTSKESKGKLDNSLNNKTNSTDSLVSKELTLFTDNKTDKQPINNQYNSHINKRILPTSKESKGDTDTPSSAKDNEMGDWSKSTDISEWQEAMHFIAFIDKISQNPQIVTSDIEQVEEALSLLISKIDQLSFDKTDDNKHIISNLKTKSGQLSIEDIVKIAKAIGNTAIEQKQQANDHKQRLSQKIVDAIGKQPHLTERIPLYNAGLVLYNPFFISFFDRLELLENRRQFRSVEHQFRAVHLLQELSKAGEAHPEHILPLNKLLCGVNILFPVGEKFTPTDKERNEIESLSKALIANWTIIKNSSIAGFQESFVRRRGVLERSDKDWILRVETKGIDILLDDIPWNIHLISLPWNDYLIHVDWKL